MKLKDWWNSRSTREHQALVLALIAVSLILAYLLVEPVYIEKQRLVREVVMLQEDLAWMETTRGEVRELQSRRPGASGKVVSPAVIEIGLRRLQLNDVVKELQPRGNDAVEIKFDNVPYERLVRFIHELKHQRGAVVKTAKIERSGASPGTVGASLLIAGR